jgi:hypothetical protein
MRPGQSFLPRRPLKTLEDERKLRDSNTKMFLRLINQGPTINFNKFERENKHKNQILRTITRFPTPKTVNLRKRDSGGFMTTQGVVTPAFL